ncbi:MAG: hypothetical protein UR66_C0003G0155 [Candidatus Moranbacteria bacterium GW2011_GWE1_35_17]|nr:MAG: hypothetical protein UR66_C0003G0155 [Candidatus Moranbacteria bacterium GW2011_GWE1_35_17]KKP72514.1 MAG: hypothetical protein UR65_C0014G0027 [Candidatus Moranbacteria bacterium GW2011_GWE2_35_164]KKP81760.1 MAG: hypothetical protein UR82_C0052G0008 [Candidatus Moranbacteria bacterium GW2011_GWF1_35_5]KKP84209.1 MAG: hypothetical protein UR83_C0025G0012 [Candidatus Moranbacteria bacterium GW2011_GWF2_35_54]
MKIITISGLDGSGKSTQIEILKNELERNGSKVFYFHAIEFSLAAKINNFKNKYCLICRLLGKCKVKKTDSRLHRNDNGKSVTKANFLQIFLRKIFLRLDLIRFKKLIQRLEKGGFDYILSDRYFYDTVINIEYLSGNKKDAINRASAKILKPHLSIYLQTDPELIMSRDRVPDQGLQYLIDKKNIYDKFSSIFEMKIVNGNGNVNDIHQEIKILL